MNYYPAFLNLKDQKVVLFGGGQVALRKAKTLVEAGADLVVVSRDFSGEFLKFAKRHRLRLRYGSEIQNVLRGSFLVIAATSDEAFNGTVSQKCKQKGIFVNVVDDPAHSSFIVPSVLKRGRLQIAISTGGASPLLAKTLRQKLEAQFGTEYGELLRRLERDRKETKKTIYLEKSRRNHFKKIVVLGLKGLKSKNVKPSLRAKRSNLRSEIASSPLRGSSQ